MEDSDASDQSSENPTSTNTGSKENSGDVKPVLPFTEKELEEYRRNKSNWEDIAIEYETDGEGFSGLGISITDVDVGHGPGDKWIFVTALTDGGAALRDGRLQVNDQILQVDGSNLRRVTREHANHVLSKTKGNVRFQIRRANETWKSKIHPLIQQTQALEQKQENPTSTNMGSEENSGDAKPVLPFTEEELEEYDDNESNWEDIAIKYETDGEGFSGLGISITDVEVGYGPFNRCIFVTALTDGGAAQRDGRLQVNDQILEVDGSYLGKQTRAYANRVLSKTEGNVSFEIRRANETWKSKMAPLIQQTQALELKQRAMRKEVTITSEPDVRQWMSDTSTQWEGATLHLHILDADTSYNEYIFTYDAEGLVKNLHSLSVFTDGILVSWVGRTQGAHRVHTLVNDALSPLLKDGCYADYGFQNGKSLIVAAPLKDEAKDSPSHHVLKLSDPQSSTRVQKCLMDNSVSDEKPAVCIVINGGIEVLRMVCHALENDIPVIVNAGTGGVAELIEDLMRCNDVRDKATILRDIKKWCQNSEAIQEEDVDRVLKLHNMGIFNRSVTTWRTDYLSTKCHLDEAICEAFLKGEKYQHAETFLRTMQKRVREMGNEVPKGCHSIVQSSGTLFGTFLQFPTTSAAAIYRSLNGIYSEMCSDQLLETYDRLQWGDDGTCIFMCKHDERSYKYKCVRCALYRYTKQLMTTPLGCPGWAKCPKCKQVLEIAEQRKTCLPAQQELFILSLFHENQHLTEAVLEHVEGKMAACMVASVVYKGRAQEEENNAEKQKLRQLASHYKVLADDCFQHCCQADEYITRELLTKTMDNWGGNSLLLIVIGTETLLDKEVFKTTMDMMWKGKMGLDTEDLGIISPQARYSLSLVFRLLFLLLFSYEVLFEVQTSPTWGFFVLAFYVFDLLVHEIRQFLFGNPLQHSAFTCNIGLMLQRYFTNTWNYFDLSVILLFLLGMLVFVDNDIAAIVGRVSLCLDVLVLCLRFLQMFMYFKTLGIFLVMAQKSFRDLANFMLIMMMVMWGYLVASHGMLFPPPNNITTTWSYLGDLPFKGYWQAFNNFDFQDFGVCQQVTRQELEDGECKTESFLATEYGHYISSVLLALYLMFINILMMNLLIAKFNNTFNEVQEKAVMHQTWYSFQLLQEHIHTPAPFFTFSLLFTFLLRCWRRDQSDDDCSGGNEEEDDSGEEEPPMAGDEDSSGEEEPPMTGDTDGSGEEEPPMTDTDLNQFETEQFQKASDALKTAVNIGSLEDVPSRLREMEKRMQQQMQDVQQGLQQQMQGMQQQMQDVQQGLQQQMQDVQQGLQQVLEKLTPADQHSTRTTQQHTATRSPEPVSSSSSTV